MNVLRATLAIAIIGLVLVVWFTRDENRPELALSPSVELAPSEVDEHLTPESAHVESDREMLREVAEAVEIASLAEHIQAELATTPDERRTLLFGFVRPAPNTGALRGDVSLSITGRWGQRSGAEIAEDGAFSVPGLVPGPWWIHVRSSHNGSVRSVIQLDGTTPTHRIELQLATELDILVRIVDPNGAPFDRLGMTVVATNVAPGLWFDERSRVLDHALPIGEFESHRKKGARVPSGSFGRVTLARATPVEISVLIGQRVLATQHVELGRREVEFVLDPNGALFEPASLRARFVDAETRAPVPDVTCLCSNDTAARSRKLDASGELFVERERPGWFTVTAFSKQGAAEVRAVLEPGVETNLGDIALESRIELSGIVLDDQGQGVAIEFDCTRIDLTDEERSSNGGVRSADDGAFRVQVAPHARYRLRVRSHEAPWSIHPTFVEMRGTSRDDVRLQLVRGVSMAVCSSGEAWNHLRFAIRDSAGELVVASRLSAPAPRVFVLKPGDYEFETRVSGASESTFTSVHLEREPVLVALP